MKGKWYFSTLSYRFVQALILLAEIILGIWIFSHNNLYVSTAYTFIKAASFILALEVLCRKDKAAIKTSWMFVLLIAPIFGVSLYAISHFQTSPRRVNRHINLMRDRSRSLFTLNGEGRSDMRFRQLEYLRLHEGFPAYDGSEVSYCSHGEAFLEQYLAALKTAEKYIFLEYFIIGLGSAWDEILAVLEEKVKAGVDVRVCFDDLGSALSLPHNYAKTLRSKGIKTIVFNPMIPILSSIQNNRNHRKITSIDGKIAFTGGINLSDEYMNRIERFGHWKDAAVKIEGKAAWSLTLMFLQMWSLITGQEEDFSDFYPGVYEKPGTNGLVQPFCDSPLDHEHVGEHIYLQMISSARERFYITTPYLIIDDSMVSALCLAAKSGVDVRIVTPGIPDKKLVYCATRSYYRMLQADGVKIYEYSPGFIHSKNALADDNCAVVGTVNLDFRSMFLHFECGVCLYDTDCIADIRQDFEEIFKVSRLIPPVTHRFNFFVRLWESFLRLIAPLI